MYTKQFYSLKKKINIMSLSEKLIKTETIILDEISQNHGEKYYIIPLMCENQGKKGGKNEWHERRRETFGVEGEGHREGGGRGVQECN